MPENKVPYVWGDVHEVPVFFHPPPDDVAEAFMEALRGLFDRYPFEQEVFFFTNTGNKVDEEHARTWRSNALQYAYDGKLTLALCWAQGTGVPSDELISMALLLGAEPRS